MSKIDPKISHDLSRLSLEDILTTWAVREEAFEEAYAYPKIEHALAQGKLISEARKRLPSDNDFGEWFRSGNIPDHIQIDTARNQRKLFENFGHTKPKTIKKIGMTRCYRITDEKLVKALIERAENTTKRLTNKDVEEIKTVLLPPPEPKPEPEPEPEPKTSAEEAAFSKERTELNDLSLQLNHLRTSILSLIRRTYGHPAIPNVGKDFLNPLKDADWIKEQIKSLETRVGQINQKYNSRKMISGSDYKIIKKALAPQGTNSKDIARQAWEIFQSIDPAGLSERDLVQFAQIEATISAYQMGLSEREKEYYRKKNNPNPALLPPA